ncbi:MAG: NAD(+)/NADH kinase [bacterium]
MNKIKNVSLLVNHKKKNIDELLIKLLQWFKKKKINVSINEEIKDILKKNFNYLNYSKLTLESDILIVLGGDGTLLYSINVLAFKNIPVLGINVGNMGFLTSISTQKIYSDLEIIFNGNYKIENRMLIKASILRKGKKIKCFTALNDFVITKKEALARMIKIETLINEKSISVFLGDGLIISTPTGSTAHSLSAGGPIVNPLLNAFIITPICAHTLTMKPLVVKSDEKISVKVSSNHKMIMLTIDGQRGFNILPNDEIVIEKETWDFQLITLLERNFYEVLREKLNWG